jgi:nucleoside phosphorylase
MAARRPRTDQYTLGWVCAVPIELAAAQQMLDEQHDLSFRNASDTNIYTLGRIAEHNVVIACLPYSQMGTTSAAVVAAQMKSAFPTIQFVLMVGIGGGVPRADLDIRLGDVVVSRPNGLHGGVVQYDFGKATKAGLQRTRFLNNPPTLLLNAIAKLEAKHDQEQVGFVDYVSQLNKLKKFKRELAGPDLLFKADYDHVDYDHFDGEMCAQCSKENIIERKSRDREIMIHYGTIASGNQVVKNGLKRDRLSSELGEILCFEMEAAGLMNDFPCLVIRGICDYADSHKHKGWQGYAAATAAAYAKEVLSVIPPVEAPRWNPSHHTTQAMMQSSAAPPEYDANRRLRLLCLDGGGVRGLSSLHILKQLMEKIEPLNPPKPCEYFDMIGGTGTGGLIATMLGRLRMDVDSCIEAYTDLCDKAFTKKHFVPVTVGGKLQAKFDTGALENGLKDIIKAHGLDEESLLKDHDGECKT